jgi:hypothetical protein
MILNICFSSFYFGYAIGYLGSFDFDTIQQTFHISFNEDTANGLITGMVPVGGGVGAICSLFLLKYFSRRYDMHII